MNDLSHAFDAQEIERMQWLLQRQRQAFNAQPFPPRSVRLNNLKRLVAALRRYQQRIVGALEADYGGRAAFETLQIEVLGSVLQARHAMAHLRRWMKTERRKTELLLLGNQAWVQYQPKGVVGIVGTWNFPLYLTLGPLIAALAAGNRAMIKVSEYSPNSRQVLQEMLAEVFDEDEVAVFGGQLASAQAFTRLPFDHLVYTGAPQVGRQVMQAAAEHLVPVTLELGGKSPVLVGPDADLDEVAMRVAHGKGFNAGQICVSPDYALVPEGKALVFAEAVKRAFERLYPNPDANADYTCVITERHAQRLQALVADARDKGAVVLQCGGGQVSPRRLPLQVITGVTDDMSVAQEEIFGPLLPIVEYGDLGQAIAYIQARPRPLALYPFGLNTRQTERVLSQTHSGGVTLGDCTWHVLQHDLPFGGVGNSGMGSYHGEEGFRTLSHGKAVLNRRRWFPIQLFYPPYGSWVQRLVLRVYLGKPR
ncbi:coniferyl aldehyde dehydrogenase [Pseudomonas kairouanensis]|uniref:Aldehyde dehydrogenase n=1 Tax=Pseudomonas kairouanensis TaxID=2293832 RepID=A0A4Z0AEQ9_9PSED|nr:coniferyl aldehyde dehydrogenase [Pseudomonas kairouanensis]TFY85105.1 coniferyl aldehyde dehydrogenase [Pseudomonas kairouanensis]